MIRKEGHHFVLYTKDGTRRLGVHATREQAAKQEAAIEARKNDVKKRGGR